MFLRDNTVEPFHETALHKLKKLIEADKIARI